MAATFSIIYRQRPRGPEGRKMNRVEMTMDNNYVTGGYAVSADNAGMITQLDTLHCQDMDSGFFFQWDRTNKKVKVGLIGSGGQFTEVSNAATGLNGLKVALWCEGS